MNFFIIAILIILIDFITVRGIKKAYPEYSSRHRTGIHIAIVIQLIFSLAVVLGGYFLEHRTRDYHRFALYYYLFGLTLAIYIPKVLFILFLLADWVVSVISRLRRRNLDIYPREPRHLVAKTGFVASIVLVCVILWGMFFGRFNFTVETVEVPFETLPPAFNNYMIVQISDIHAGSFAGFIGRFQKAVDMINELDPDLIVFTGDMVNNFAEEANPLVPIFSQLTARDGKYANLGNHDYGGYFRWKSPTDSVANHAELEQVIERMGFTLLNNESVVISKDKQNRIALVGIENWGKGDRHPKRGDIELASKTVADIPFKVLLSHDPSFWSEKVVGKVDIPLTLSGHTHGMQMGIRFGKHHFGPATLLRHKYWEGLYQEGEQYMYINRGLGVIGYPGRIGMSPEITVITLQTKK